MASRANRRRVSEVKRVSIIPIGDDYPHVRVRPTSRSMVAPAKPTDQHWLALSNLDRVVNPTFSSVILVYVNLLEYSHCQFQEITRSLKDALAKALVYFYPLAGRLALRKDGQVDIHCNDAGAVFIEAVVEAELSPIGGPRPMPSLSGLEVAGLGKGPRYIPDQITSIPTLVVQVTKFQCGSVAIAANWHHTVADGWSGCQFLNSWAEIRAGREVSLHPNHDRFLLQPRKNPDSSLVRGYNSSTGVTGKTLSSNCNLTKYRKQGIKESIIRTLDTDKDGCFTTTECMSAQLWREMVAKARVGEPEGAKNSSESDYSITRFFLSVDGRRRLNLPAGYFGNVMCRACAVATEEDILNKPLVHTASLIRKATRSVSGDYFRSLIDWVEIQGRSPAKSTESPRGHMHLTGQDVAATFWTMFPLYEVDFGWGRPTLAARNSPPRPLIDGIVLLPGSEGQETF